MPLGGSALRDSGPTASFVAKVTNKANKCTDNQQLLSEHFQDCAVRGL